MKSANKTYDKKESVNYEKDIIDVDEISGTDVKINPDYYIHITAEKLPTAIINPDPKEGFMQYQTLVVHLEMLCKASKRVPPDYEQLLTEFKKTDYYSKAKNEDAKSMRLSMKKAELLLGRIFYATPSRKSLLV